MSYEKLPEIKSLEDLPNPPKELFYLAKVDSGRGQNDIMEIFGNCVAVVGSRRMTDYGKRVIEKLIPQLVFEKKTIVSGFMYGVDQYAHKVCLENGGKTIAVLGWGIKNTPKDDLAEKIISSGGLLISEWEDQEATLWTFPLRNRIVTALSNEVYVVEAGEKSGSLITANLAIKLKRKLWAVPGPITSKVSVGTNNLIATGKAKMWLGQPQQQTLENDDPILKILENESLTADELARKLNKPVTEIGAQLSLFSLEGKIVDKGGKYYLSGE